MYAVVNSAGRSHAAASPHDTESDTLTDTRLLAGGNPQIPKGEGDAPVQAYRGQNACMISRIASGSVLASGSR
jgi:hypothetical protein